MASPRPSARLSNRNLVPSVTALEPRVLFAAITFAEPAYYAAGAPLRNTPENVATGDFTGDGIPDLVVAGPHATPLAVVADWVRVLPGKGDGTFGEPLPPRMLPASLSSIVTADFNRDGRLDVAATQDAQQGMVHVLLGNGDGTFGPPGSFHSGSRSQDLAVADFDNDGHLDLAVANAEQWSPWGTRIASMHAGALLGGNGDGTFDREQFIDTGRRPQHFIEAGDVNGDGHMDVVFAQVVIGPGDFAAPESRVFASIANLDVPVRPPTTVPAAVTGMKLADLSGDGRLDVAVSGMRNFLGDGAVAAVLDGTGDGRFGSAKLHELPSVVATDVAVADFDADGRHDLAVAGEDMRWGRPMPVPAVLTLRNTGRGVLDAPVLHSLPGDAAYPGRLAVGMFNRDRLPDVAVALPGSNRVGVLINNTRAIFASPVRLHTTVGNTAAKALTRFTVSGPRPSPGDFRVTIHWGDGTARSVGRVEANSDGSFTIFGSHAYRRPGIYRVHVVITWEDAQVARIVSGIARVTIGRTVPTV